MGKRGFLAIKRTAGQYRPVCERVADYRHVALPRPDKVSIDQGERCMDCGTPFCHWGCPLDNIIPEWNETMAHGHWDVATKLLSATNNLPEITGRLCPALCEYSCVLGINDDPVTIRENELAIVEHAFKSGLIKPCPPKKRTRKRVAVIGSGPAGLACADQLNKSGHNVVVFERDDKIGGILRYGIPDFKLEKSIIDRRIKILQKEGLEFRTGVNVGVDMPVAELSKEFDATCLACGSRVPRDLKIEGRELKGIYFAMDFLIQANRRSAGEKIPAGQLISAKGKRVVVIGGGDTGADCVGTSHRQGATCVVQIEVLPQPPACRGPEYPWPRYPLLLKTSTSHEEGGQRQWSILTKKFIGKKGHVAKLSCVKADFTKDENGCPAMREVPSSSFEIEADMVILAVGFVHPEHEGLVESLGITCDPRGNIQTDQAYMTNVKRIFTAGDMRRGQSLIVWAIAEGRRAAASINAFLR